MKLKAGDKVKMIKKTPLLAVGKIGDVVLYLGDDEFSILGFDRLFCIKQMLPDFGNDDEDGWEQVFKKARKTTKTTAEKLGVKECKL